VYSLPAEPQLDHVWVREAEWKSMVPYNPSLGFTFEAPKRSQTIRWKACQETMGLATPPHLFGGWAGALVPDDVLSADPPGARRSRSAAGPVAVKPASSDSMSSLRRPGPAALSTGRV
jgi:hypothetical protein